MFINSFLLALSSSIDSLGIGITYGIKNTKISYLAETILFIISFSISILSVYFGNVIKAFCSTFIAKLIGNLLLITMGFFICFQAIYKNYTRNFKSSKKINFLGITTKIIKDPNYSDLDFSNSIDGKEAIFLGFALSIDCFCIGIGGSILGVSPFLFPLFISLFQLIFLNVGIALGKCLYNSISFLPDNIWSIISGILLIIMGLIRFL